MHLLARRTITFDRTELPRDWRRFAAVLCLMAFFSELVGGGTELWQFGLPQGHQSPSALLQSWAALCRFGLGLALFLAGRSLWHGYRRTRWWLAACLVATALLWLVEWRGQLQFDPTRSLGYPDSPWLHWMIPPGAPLFCALMLTLWLSRWPLPWFRTRYPNWVALAAVWALGSAAISLPSNMWLGFTGLVLYRFGACWWLVLVTTRLPLAIMGVMILLRCRGVRLAAISAATVEVTTFAYLTVNGVPQWLYCSIIRLLISARYSPGWLPTPFPFDMYWLNRESFLWLIELVGQAGPWILIAIYARRHPMRVPPDDGSPFPRRYCGRCWYNLHGIDLSVCPECGRQLVEK